MITNYLRNTTVRFGGARPSLYLADATAPFTLTWSGDTVSAITITGTTRMHELQADIDSVTFTSEGEWGQSGFDTQTLTAKFGTATPLLNASLIGLKRQMPRGLWAIYIDNNRRGWLVGLAPAADDFHNDFFRTLSVNYTTGESLENVEDGNIESIVLTRVSATNKYPLTPALTTSIISNAATAFITYAV